MMLTSACRDDTFSEFRDNNSDEFTVTLNVALEGMGNSTRSEEENDKKKIKTRFIGDGSQIDMLVYAVYYKKKDQDGNETWEAATEYVKEYEAEDQKPFDGAIEAGYGQTILDVKETLQKGEPQPITLTLKKGFAYKVVFWAQNHETEAFVIDDLKRVQMKYKVLHVNMDVKDENVNLSDNIRSVNNDEARDAFCRAVDLNGDQSNRNITIYLRRPLAQINVGTRGFDFETITRNADKKYLYSKIRINKAARYLNVVEDYVYTNTVGNNSSIIEDKEAFYTIDYEYNKLPAYWDMEIPKYPSYTIYDLENKEKGAFDIFKKNHPGQLTGGEDNDSEEDVFRNIYGKEEFLKVHIFDHDEETKSSGKFEDEDDDGYYTYACMGAAGDEANNKQSEVFKYLSMCYILTPTNGSNTLTNLKMWVATDTVGSDEVEVVNLNNVPVKANHRTNIVGELLTAKAEMQIYVDEDFAGKKNTGDVTTSGEIVEGFYYDADNNEFQISSVNGLLFFQQLVNGDLTVRQVHPGSSGSEEGPYPYYDPESTGSNPRTLYLKYNSWTKNDFPADVAERILTGTGYKNLINTKVETISGKTWTIVVQKKDNWPEYNNFPFYGATVKLMADLDLSGIEWIPIGFDCANWDSTFGEYRSKYIQPYNGISYITLISERTGGNDNTRTMNLGNRRVFCGTFDGNGHTIYNLTTKKFGGNVHIDALQEFDIKGGEGPDKEDLENKGGPYDNVQWFAKGFFGVVGPNAKIKNLRIQNVDIQGQNAVGGIVGQVSSMGFPAKIVNCIVDGGVIDAVPLYRGDLNTDTYYGRTAARGCYIGGIVGQFCARDNGNDIAEITGCEVRNLTMQGYRRMGGIVGSIGDQGNKSMGISDIQLNIKIEENSVSNSLIVVNQYRAFNYFWDFFGTGKSSKLWMNGFGWGSGSGYTPMTDNIVGGYYHTPKELSLAGDAVDAFKYTDFAYTKGSTTKQAYYDDVNNKNKVYNLQYTELSVSPDVEMKDGKREATARQSIIKNVPMLYIPMFTSIFTDEVTLEQNYYGETKLHTKLKFFNAPIWVNTKTVDAKKSFSLPINFPNGYDIEYEKSSPFTGMYAESVKINGAEAPGGRSVITPTGIDGENSCVMYITARNRKQFKIDNKPKGKTPIPARSDEIALHYKKPTIISNVVLRGSPYAWAGIILAPNENMEKVELNNVTIYDVYKTLSQENDYKTAKMEAAEKGKLIFSNELQNYTDWQEANQVTLTATDCNFRGYTVPGPNWEEVKYDKTTFEQGSETKYSYDSMKDAKGKPHQNRNEYKTCKVDAKTTFTDCFFKAPYFIDLSSRWVKKVKDEKGNLIDQEAVSGEDYFNVSFSKCNGSSAYPNELIEQKYINNKTDKRVYYIRIDKNKKTGKTVIAYYGKKGLEELIYKTGELEDE